MNQLIKKQLKSIKSTNIEFDDNTTHISIPKTTEVLTQALETGQVYLIEVADNIINPPAGSTLASNWNQGRSPKSKRYIAELETIAAKMYKWNGVAQDNPTEAWYGWIPSEGFSIIEKL